MNEQVTEPEKDIMYGALAEWWPLLSAPDEYEDEATCFHQLLSTLTAPAPVTVLELGAGGGNNAFHLKAHYQLTLVDLSPGMVRVSEALNPECEHLVGDMRTVRLGRHFDAVFVHDAIEYMTTVDELRQAIHTAALHCRPGGGALFVPDAVLETFEADTDHGGHDGEGRGLRYIEWTHAPEPGSTRYAVDYVFLLREADGSVRTIHDRHHCGVFPRALWLTLLREEGFDTEIVTDDYGREIFVARKR